MKDPTKGIKFDNSKSRWELLPYREVEEVVKVLTYGAKKYTDNNWMLVVKKGKMRYFSAALRHLVAWKLGRKVDEETKLHPLAHAIACLLFLIWIDKEDK